MTLELILGPMFAGKSSHILSTVSRYEAIGWPVLSLTSQLDTRYEANSIHSHSHQRHDAISLKKLHEVCGSQAYKDAKLLVIEEAQFFDDLLTFVLFSVEKKGKDVLVVGLDGDADRKPFGQVLQLIPYCDKVTKLTALCKTCGDGTKALFTYRKLTTTPIIQVGSDDLYEALCRAHYLEKRGTFL
jgi:thymidine kinase